MDLSKPLGWRFMRRRNFRRREVSVAEQSML